MLFKRLGSTDVRIPEVGLGTWNYHAGPMPLRRGLDAGALFIDTAESYGTETVVGEAVRGRRDRVFLASKVASSNFRAPDFRRAVDASLQRLGTDVIDLLQLHQPNQQIPIDETMGAMAAAIDAGKVRFAGVSNFSVSQLQQAQKALGKHPIVSNQVRYSVIDRTIERGLLQYCQAHHVTVIAYSPLARGLQRVTDCDPSGALATVARATGTSPAQVALNWCLCKDNVVVIPKGNSEAHVLDNCAASGWRLTTEQIGYLDSHIRYRQRGWFDSVVRRGIPAPLHALAVLAVRSLPRSLRRRLT